MRCDKCKFWEKNYLENQGICRRYPPHFDPNTEPEQGEYGYRLDRYRNFASSFIFPVTTGDDWCGEFKELVPILEEGLHC